jgi:hypothetical protein
VVDASDPTAPHILGCTDLPGAAEGRDVALAEDQAVVACSGWVSLVTVDISNPQAPLDLGQLPGSPYLGAFGVALGDGHAFLATHGGIDPITSWSYLMVVDVGDPAAPALVSSLETQGMASDVGTLQDSKAVLVADGWLRVIDVWEPSQPLEVAVLEPWGRGRGVAVSGPCAYLADSRGLRVIDVSVPGAPVEAGSAETPGTAHSVAVDGPLAVLAEISNGLRILDVSNPASPFEVGFFEIDNPWQVAIQASTALVTDSADRLRIIDVSEPGNPLEIASVPAPGARGVAVSGPHAYVAAEELWVIGLAEPGGPAVLGRLELANHASDVVARGKLVFITSPLRVVDVSDPTAPAVIGVADIGGSGIAVSGERVFLARGYGGVLIVDVSDPTAPVAIDSVYTPDEALDIAADAGRGFVASAGAGLQIIGSCGLLFADGFELGNTLAWSRAGP